MTVASDVVERIKLAPDAGLVKSLGANHTLESAIADLVDNSIDAGSTAVSVRLLTSKDRLAQVEVLDNGRGMDGDLANDAMTIGHQREYTEMDLGHFGMGLKAASFGHSDNLTIWSAAAGAAPVGRRIRRADFSKDFTCEILAEDLAAKQAAKREAILGSGSGTSIVWTEVRNTYRGRSSDDARSWLAARSDTLRCHLGITFHRLLSSGRLRIDVLVDELGDELIGQGIPVLAVDPFSYITSGHPAYPKDLQVKAGGKSVKLSCHIWPAKSDVTGFRLGAKNGERFQGFYIYRNDRLLQIGGWSDTATPSAARQLARVVLEDSDAIGPFLVMNPEKNGLRFEPVFHDAINKAESSDGTTLLTYLQDAEAIYTDANKRRRQRKPAIRPDKGFAPAVRKRIAGELPFTNSDPMSIKWRRMPDGDFFDVSLQDSTIWLNNRYRGLFSPTGGTLNDAPLLKALMYLLTHQVFEGQLLGSRDRDDIALWRSVLGTAAATEAHIREQ